MKLLRPALCLALIASLLAVGGAGAAAKKPTLKLGPNLVLNPSFETSTVEAATANAVPVLPVSWTVEGATVLFDYNQRVGRTGKRHVAVSGSLAPGKQACDASADGTFRCVPNPAASVTGQVNDAAMSRFSVRPFWVTDKAIAVRAGKPYRFAMWTARPSIGADGVAGEGAASKVRWFDAGGAVLKVVDGPSLLKTAKRQLGFQQATLDVTAPAGAVGADLLLGFTDYTVTSAQVAFDDITFQEILRR